MFQKQSETTWLQLGLNSRNANNKIQCTRSTNSTANRTIKLWKCKTKHNSQKTIGNLNLGLAGLWLASEAVRGKLHGKFIWHVCSCCIRTLYVSRFTPVDRHLSHVCHDTVFPVGRHDDCRGTPAHQLRCRTPVECSWAGECAVFTARRTCN